MDRDDNLPDLEQSKNLTVSDHGSSANIAYDKKQLLLVKPLYPFIYGFVHVLSFIGATVVSYYASLVLDRLRVFLAYDFHLFTCLIVSPFLFLFVIGKLYFEYCAYRWWQTPPEEATPAVVEMKPPNNMAVASLRKGGDISVTVTKKSKGLFEVLLNWHHNLWIKNGFLYFILAILFDSALTSYFAPVFTTRAFASIVSFVMVLCHTSYDRGIGRAAIDKDTAYFEFRYSGLDRFRKRSSVLLWKLLKFIEGLLILASLCYIHYFMAFGMGRLIQPKDTATYPTGLGNTTVILNANQDVWGSNRRFYNAYEPQIDKLWSAMSLKIFSSHLLIFFSVAIGLAAYAFALGLMNRSWVNDPVGYSVPITEHESASGISSESTSLIENEDSSLSTKPFSFRSQTRYRFRPSALLVYSRSTKKPSTVQLHSLFGSKDRVGSIPHQGHTPQPSSKSVYFYYHFFAYAAPLAAGIMDSMRWLFLAAIRRPFENQVLTRVDDVEIFIQLPISTFLRMTFFAIGAVVAFKVKLHMMSSSANRLKIGFANFVLFQEWSMTVSFYLIDELVMGGGYYFSYGMHRFTGPAALLVLLILIVIYCKV